MAATFQGPVGVVDVARAMADPPPGRVVSEAVKYMKYRLPRRTTSGAHMPPLIHAGLVLNASPAYVQCTRSVDRNVGTLWMSGVPSGPSSVADKASDVQYRYQCVARRAEATRKTLGSAQLAAWLPSGSLSLSGLRYNGATFAAPDALCAAAATGATAGALADG